MCFLEASHCLLPALSGGLVEAHFDGRFSTREMSWRLVPARDASLRLETILVEVLRREIEDGALPQECLDGGVIIGEGPHVLLSHLTWELTKVYIALVFGDCCSDEEAEVVGVHCALR